MIHPPKLAFGGRPVPGAETRTPFEVSGYSFQDSLSQVELNRSNAGSKVAADPASGSIELLKENQSPSEGYQVMPLRFGALQKAMAKIEEREEWLMSAPPIVKTERNGNARIDFINRGGFVFNQKGEYVSHSVNAW